MLGISSLNSIDNVIGIIIFRIGEKHFCIDLDIFSAFVNPREESEKVLALLEKEKFVKYIDEMVPIIDFYKFYGLELAPQNDYTQIIFAEYNGHKVAFYVDSIEEIVSFDRYMRETIKIIPPDGTNFLSGEILYDGKALMIPDFEAIISDVLV